MLICPVEWSATGYLLIIAIVVLRPCSLFVDEAEEIIHSVEFARTGSTMASFTYDSIGNLDIRLIKLKGSSKSSSAVQFTLKTIRLHSFHNGPDYTAVSYTWAGQIPDQAVACNGKEMLVTVNALQALKRLRRRMLPRYLWLDAICIDQANAVEKSSQISNMSKIYENAKVVAACMPHDDEHSQTKDFIAAYDKLRNESTAEGLDPEDSYIKLFAFLNNKYWERIWTIQEMVLNENCEIYLGMLPPIPARHLRYLSSGALRKIDSHLTAPADLAAQANHLVDALLWHKATEPQDYILGIMYVYRDTLVPAALSSTNNVQQLYTYAAFKILQCRGFKLLFIARHPSKLPGCPS